MGRAFCFVIVFPAAARPAGSNAKGGQYNAGKPYDRKNSGGCWTWSILATGSSIPSAAQTASRIMIRSKASCSAWCRGTPLDELAEVWDGNVVPSRAFNDGGIQEAIVNYEDAVFFDVLAEELARRDMGYPQITRENYDDLVGRMEDYLEEFEAHGTDNIVVEAH